MSEFTFRTGKHAGQTLDWVKENDLGYFTWVKKNRPEMLKEPKAKEIKNNFRYKPLTPNLDFDNEPAEVHTKKKIETKKENNDDEPKWNF